jgi:signal transduction histidine kinase
MILPVTKLLLVEDNPGDAGLVRLALEEASGPEWKFEMLRVERLSEAVEALKQSSFDLVLLDLSLPDAHGFDTVVRMRNAAPTLPIVIMTGLDDQALAIEAMRRGAQDYLVKGQVDSAWLARAVRYAIERKRTEAQINRQLQRQTVLNEINQAITSTLDLQSVMDILLDKIGKVFPHLAMLVRVLDTDKKSLEGVAFRNLDHSSWENTASPPGASLSNAVIEAKTPLLIRDVQNDPRSRRPEFLRKNGFVSYLGLPLIVKEEAVGVLAFFSREADAFAKEDVDFLSTLAGQAAIAIHNSALYERLKTANETLEKALDVKSVLTGVMAHELKTPIQVIMGAAGLLSSGICGELTEEQSKPIVTIERGADELLELIDRTLQMARLDQGKIPLTLCEVAVAELLAELRSDFDGAFRAKGVELEVADPTDRPVMNTDRVKVKEILRNLLENARKFTAQGKVTVGFAEQPDGTVEFVVSDTGIGISKESLPKIFDLFFQVDPAAKQHASAGMGLNIVKRLVAALCGEIEVSSEPGKGTSFRVTLPKVVADLNSSF